MWTPGEDDPKTNGYVPWVPVNVAFRASYGLSVPGLAYLTCPLYVPDRTVLPVRARQALVLSAVLADADVIIPATPERINPKRRNNDAARGACRWERAEAM